MSKYLDYQIPPVRVRQKPRRKAKGPLPETDDEGRIFQWRPPKWVRRSKDYAEHYGLPVRLVQMLTRNGVIPTVLDQVGKRWIVWDDTSRETGRQLRDMLMQWR